MQGLGVRAEPIDLLRERAPGEARMGCLTRVVQTRVLLVTALLVLRPEVDAVDRHREHQPVVVQVVGGCVAEDVDAAVWAGGRLRLRAAASHHVTTRNPGYVR